MIIVVWATGTKCAIEATREEAKQTIANLLESGMNPDEIQVFEADQGSRVKIDW